jgi:hypothetical protein
MTADWYATKKSLEQDLETVNQVIEDGRQHDAIPKPASFPDRSPRSPQATARHEKGVAQRDLSPRCPRAPMNSGHAGDPDGWRSPFNTASHAFRSDSACGSFHIDQ